MIFQGNYGLLCCLILMTGLSWSVSGCRSEENCISYEECSQRHEGSRVAVQRCINPPGTVCCPDALLPYDDCGFDSTKRVINGNITKPGDLPWMVLLGYRPRNSTSQEPDFNCGGTLISNRYVLTAAHCVVTSATGPPYFVRLGESDLRQDPDKYNLEGHVISADRVKDVEVERVISHKDFSFNTLKNDIALLRLKTPVERFTDYIKPICLPFDLKPIEVEDHEFEVAGWGTTSHSNIQRSDVLLSGKVFGVHILDCNENHDKRLKPLDQTQICAANINDEVEAAKGDSGGPLFELQIFPNDPARVHQFGIISFRKPMSLGSNFAPTVFTKVSAYKAWILKNLKP